MAITKVGAMTDPPVSGDYTILQAKLDAYSKQIGNQGMILTEWTNTTTAPAIALGSYITHGGTLFVVKDEDYVITNPPGADGTFYLLVKADGDSLIGVWTSSLTGFSWNAIYNGLYDPSGDQILPYQLAVSGAVSALGKWKIINLAQGGAFIRVNYLGQTIANEVYCSSLDVTGAISGASVDTGQGANELYGMNQGVKTTDRPTFAGITATGSEGTRTAGTRDSNSNGFGGPVTRTGNVPTNFGTTYRVKKTGTYTFRFSMTVVGYNSSSWGRILIYAGSRNLVDVQFVSASTETRNDNYNWFVEAGETIQVQGMTYYNSDTSVTVSRIQVLQSEEGEST